MSRPTEEELSIALQQAKRLRESGADEFHLAKTVLNLDYRIRALEQVLDKTKRYLHSGQGSHEHTLLLKAIENAEKAEAFLGEEPPGFVH